MNESILLHVSYLNNLPTCLRDILIDRAEWSEDGYYLINKRDVMAVLSLLC